MKTREFLDVLCAALLREPGSLTLEDTPMTVEEWDSVGHLSLLSAIESNFDIPINDVEFRNFSSVEQVVTLLKKRGALED